MKNIVNRLRWYLCGDCDYGRAFDSVQTFFDGTEYVHEAFWTECWCHEQSIFSLIIKRIKSFYYKTKFSFDKDIPF